jgi:hypothetical protein
MKNTLFTTLFLFGLTISCFSQECNYTKNSVDKFTGDRTIETEPILLIKQIKNDAIFIKNVQMILRKENENRYFTLYYTVMKGSPTFMGGTNNNKLICLLDNGQTVELPMSGPISDILKYDRATHFTISNDIFELLLHHDIKDIRAVSSINPVDFEVENVKTKGYFECIK